ncbi:hypothetical protein L9F63_005500, partial [Diploptera punctata]
QMESPIDDVRDILGKRQNSSGTDCGPPSGVSRTVASTLNSSSKTKANRSGQRPLKQYYKGNNSRKLSTILEHTENFKNCNDCKKKENNSRKLLTIQEHTENFKNMRNLVITNKKVNVPDSKKSGIYQISCNDCKKQSASTGQRILRKTLQTDSLKTVKILVSPVNGRYVNCYVTKN